MQPFATRPALHLLAAAALAATAGAAQATDFQFQVFARENSTAFNSQDASPLATGLFFGVGSALHITASGLWNGGACGDVGPDGTTCFGNDPTTGINYYALIGRIGSGSYFRIGSAYDGTAATSGQLFLAFLDSDSFNNTGFVTATVSVVPEPSTWALGLAGAAAIAAVVRRRSA